MRRGEEPDHDNGGCFKGNNTAAGAAMVAAGKAPVHANVPKCCAGCTRCSLMSFLFLFVVFFFFYLTQPPTPFCYTCDDATDMHTQADIASPFARLWRANSRVTSPPAPDREDARETSTSERVFSPH